MAEFRKQCDQQGSFTPNSENRKRLALNDRVRSLETEISHLQQQHDEVHFLVARVCGGWTLIGAVTTNHWGAQNPGTSTTEAFADKQIEALIRCINTFRTWSEVWGSWHTKQDDRVQGVQKAATLLQEQISHVLSKSLVQTPHAAQPVFSSSAPDLNASSAAVTSSYPAVSGG